MPVWVKVGAGLAAAQVFSCALLACSDVSSDGNLSRGGTAGRGANPAGSAGSGAMHAGSGDSTVTGTAGTSPQVTRSPEDTVGTSGTAGAGPSTGESGSQGSDPNLDGTESAGADSGSGAELGGKSGSDASSAGGTDSGSEVDAAGADSAAGVNVGGRADSSADIESGGVADSTGAAVASGGAGPTGGTDGGGTSGDSGLPYANVTAVSASGEPGAYVFSVSVESADIDCSQYADWWEILSEDGSLIYRRILNHSHTDENGTTDEGAPGNTYTRTGGPVPIRADQVVLIRAHMSNTGYTGMVMRGSVADGFVQAPEIGANFAIQVENEDPQPGDCLF